MNYTVGDRGLHIPLNPDVDKVLDNGCHRPYKSRHELCLKMYDFAKVKPDVDKVLDNGCHRPYQSRHELCLKMYDFAKVKPDVNNAKVNPDVFDNG